LKLRTIVLVTMILISICVYFPRGASEAASTPVMPVGLAGHNGFPANRWKIVSDFNFPGSSINTKQWAPNWRGDSNTSITHGFQPIYDQNCFNPKNVVVANGILTLHARAGTCMDSDGFKHPYSGGMVSSSVGGTYSYAYFEAKIFFPGGHCVTGDIPPKQLMCINNHPAFWLTSANTDAGINTVEIDIAEGLHGRLCSLTHFTAPGYRDRNVMHCSTVGPPAWHVYGAMWTPGVVRFYLDGKLIYTSKTPAQFKTPAYIILNNAVPTKWKPVTPAGMKVAYVRVWNSVL